MPLLSALMAERVTNLIKASFGEWYSEADPDGGAGGGGAPPPREKKRSLIFFCVLARGTQQANVREQRLVHARTSATARRQFYSFRRLSVSGLSLTQKSEVSAWTFVEV